MSRLGGQSKILTNHKKGMQWILLLTQLKRQQCHGYMSFVVSAKPRRGCWRHWLQKGWKLLVTPRASWFESTEVAPSHTLVTLNVFPQSRIVGGGEKALFTMESLFPMEVNLRFSCYKDACTNLFLKDSQRFMLISLPHVPRKIKTVSGVNPCPQFVFGSFSASIGP